MLAAFSLRLCVKLITSISGWNDCRPRTPLPSRCTLQCGRDTVLPFVTISSVGHVRAHTDYACTLDLGLAKDTRVSWRQNDVMRVVTAAALLASCSAINIRSAPHERTETQTDRQTRTQSEKQRDGEGEGWRYSAWEFTRPTAAVAAAAVAAAAVVVSCRGINAFNLSISWRRLACLWSWLSTWLRLCQIYSGLTVAGRTALRDRPSWLDWLWCRLSSMRSAVRLETETSRLWNADSIVASSR